MNRSLDQNAATVLLHSKWDHESSRFVPLNFECVYNTNYCIESKVSNHSHMLRFCAEGEQLLFSLVDPRNALTSPGANLCRAGLLPSIMDAIL